MKNQIHPLPDAFKSLLYYVTAHPVVPSDYKAQTIHETKLISMKRIAFRVDTHPHLEPITME